MPETKSIYLPYVSSTLTFNSFQKEEFERSLNVYNRVYNYLLLQWLAYSKGRPLLHIGPNDNKYIFDKMHGLLHRDNWIEEDLKVVAINASKELYSNLFYKNEAGVALPNENDLRKLDTVIFHKDFDIKIKENRLTLPVVGKAVTGRFSYFSGSIKAVGVRWDRFGNEHQAMVYYKNNSELFIDKPDTVWMVKGCEVQKSPLNLELRKAGIGFMK